MRWYFLTLLERWHLPTLANTKKPIWRNLLSIQNGAVSLVAMCSMELWLVQKNHATVKLDSNGFSRNENLQQKQKRTAKSTNLKENAGTVKSVFVIRAGCHTWLTWFLKNENLQQKQKRTAKSTNLKENAGKVKSVFVIRATLWAENVMRILTLQ